jgi:hypothetical protein
MHHKKILLNNNLHSYVWSRFRPEYLIVDAGTAAGTGAGSYTLGSTVEPAQVEPAQACGYDGSQRVHRRTDARRDRLTILAREAAWDDSLESRDVQYQ